MPGRLVEPYSLKDLEDFSWATQLSLQRVRATVIALTNAHDTHRSAALATIDKLIVEHGWLSMKKDDTLPDFLSGLFAARRAVEALPPTIEAVLFPKAGETS